MRYPVIALILGTCLRVYSQTADPARLWVRLMDEQGAPTAARIYVTDASGNHYVPSGSLGREAWENAETFSHASGQFQVEVPAGVVIVEAVKGFEFTPVKQWIEVKRNQTTSVTLTLKRWIDPPSLGWYSGDVHMHLNHDLAGVYMTMEDGRLYAQAEDIHVANLLISNTDTSHIFDQEYFNGGKPDPLSTSGYLLVAQQEFRNNSIYGHMPLLGISRLVEPFFSGHDNSKQWEDYPANYSIAKAAKEQGGAVCYTHPIFSRQIPVNQYEAREFPVDLALGVVDALDINFRPEDGCWMYYRVLNCGLKCTASSGSDSRMNVMQREIVSGSSKVYVKTGNSLSYEKWIGGYKAGRTFVTNGPMLFLEVDGKEPGAEIHIDRPRSLNIRVRAQSPVIPISVVELIVNGEVASSAKPATSGGSVDLHQTLRLDRSSWIAARAWGKPQRLVLNGINDPRAFAHTSPVYCYVSRQRIALPNDARIMMVWIDRLLQDVTSSPRFSTEAKRSEVIALFRRARKYYQDILPKEQ